MARVLRYVIIGCSYFLLCEVLLSFKSVLKKERLSGFRVVLFIVIYNKLLNKGVLGLEAVLNIFWIKIVLLSEQKH